MWRSGSKKALRTREKPLIEDKNVRFQYYRAASSKDAESTPRKQTIGQNRWRLVPTYLAVFAIVASVLMSLTLSTSVRIEFLNDQDEIYRTKQAYADAASEIMSKKLENQTKITIQTNTIEEAMRDKFPELQAAQVRLPVLGRMPTLVLDVSEPSLILVSENKSYVLTSNGVVVAEAQVLKQPLKDSLLVVRDESGLPVKIGTQVVTSASVTFIRQVVAQFKNQNIPISQLTLPSSPNQLNIQIQGLSYYIKMDISGDARLQAGSYLSVRDLLSREGGTVNEYIDVRVEEKVFYK